MLSGYKTYITGVLAVLGAVGGWLAGDLAIADAIQLAVTALLAMFIRSGVASTGTK
jgi:hypothetical protein